MHVCMYVCMCMYVHIGNVIGRNASEFNILNARNDNIMRMNVFTAYFGNTCIHTKYNLFNIFCMSVYGSVLWTIHPMLTCSIQHGGNVQYKTHVRFAS